MLLNATAQLPIFWMEAESLSNMPEVLEATLDTLLRVAMAIAPLMEMVKVYVEFPPILFIFVLTK